MSEIKYGYDIDFSNANLDSTLPVISITDVLNYLEHPFDKEGVARKTFEKHFNNPQSIYYQKTVEQIIDMWSATGAESCRYGSLLDDYIGIRLTKSDVDLRLFKLDNAYDNDERLQRLCESFESFYKLLTKSGDMVFVSRERTLYLKVNVQHPVTNEYISYYVKGRFDALFYNKRTNKWVIIDWKSSGSVDKVPTRYTGKFYGPMIKYPELNYYRYTNQLHFYKKALLDNYLPIGTHADDIVVMIVNLPGKIVQESGQNYMTHLAAMPYDSLLLDNIFQFAISKRILENKVSKEDSNENVVIEEKSDNVENLF